MRDFDNGIVARDSTLGGEVRVSGYNFSIKTLIEYLQEGMTTKDISEYFVIPESKIKAAYTWYVTNKGGYDA